MQGKVTERVTLKAGGSYEFRQVESHQGFAVWLQEYIEGKTEEHRVPLSDGLPVPVVTRGKDFGRSIPFGVGEPKALSSVEVVWDERYHPIEGRTRIVCRDVDGVWVPWDVDDEKPITHVAVVVEESQYGVAVITDLVLKAKRDVPRQLDPRKYLATSEVKVWEAETHHGIRVENVTERMLECVVRY